MTPRHKKISRVASTLLEWFAGNARDRFSNFLAVGITGMLFWQVAIKPAKPTYFGTYAQAGQEKLVFGLPGNPVSALVNGSLFVVPVLEQLLGVQPKPRATVSARLTINLASQAGREDWWPVRLIASNSSRTVHYDAEPIFGKSNLIFTLVRADGLVRIPADANGLAAGEMVAVHLF